MSLDYSLNKIHIYEMDATKGYLENQENTDIAFVPGFSTKGPEKVPTLCRSLFDLEEIFGEGLKFEENQVYDSKWSDKAHEAAGDGDDSSADVVMAGFEAGTNEPGYAYAEKLLTAGLWVVFERVPCDFVDTEETTPTVDAMYAFLGDTDESPYLELLDKGTFSVKYLTSGGYPVFEYDSNAIVNKMIACAYCPLEMADGTKEASARGRGDCIALIDHTNYAGRDLTGADSVFAVVGSLPSAPQAAMFTPWINYTDGSVMPGSYTYLSCLAASIKNNPNWLAIAGVTRGLVSGVESLNTEKTLSNLIADNYQPDTGVSINAVTNIRPYGYCIWGNRTLCKNSGTTASSFLNTRNMICDIKKKLYETSKSLMFEQNTDVLWINFKAAVAPLLDKMVMGNGLASYKFIKRNTKVKGKLDAIVQIVPVYALEKVDITVFITDSDVEVEEE